MIPKNITETPLGTIRRTNNKGRTISLVQNKNGWIDKQYVTMAKAKEITGDYFVFSFPETFESINVEDINGKYAFRKAQAVEGWGFKDFQKAQDKYIEETSLRADKVRKKWEVGKVLTKVEYL